MTCSRASLTVPWGLGRKSGGSTHVPKGKLVRQLGKKFGEECLLREDRYLWYKGEPSGWLGQKLFGQLGILHVPWLGFGTAVCWACLGDKRSTTGSPVSQSPCKLTRTQGRLGSRNPWKKKKVVGFSHPCNGIGQGQLVTRHATTNVGIWGMPGWESPPGRTARQAGANGVGASHPCLGGVGNHPPRHKWHLGGSLPCLFHPVCVKQQKRHAHTEPTKSNLAGAVACSLGTKVGGNRVISWVWGWQWGNQGLLRPHMLGKGCWGWWSQQRQGAWEGSVWQAAWELGTTKAKVPSLGLGSGVAHGKKGSCLSQVKQSKMLNVCTTTPPVKVCLGNQGGGILLGATRFAVLGVGCWACLWWHWGTGN